MFTMSQIDPNDASMNIHKKRKDALSDAMKKTVQEFYLKPPISMEKSGKNTVSSCMYYNTPYDTYTNSSKKRLVTRIF